MYRVIPCPTCGRPNDSHDGARPGAEPKPGDLALCWGCAQPAMFTEGPLGDLRLRVCTDDEVAQVMTDPAVLAALAAMAGCRTPDEALAWLHAQASE